MFGNCWRASMGSMSRGSIVRPLEPIIEIAVDLQRAQEVGIKPGDVRRSAAVLLSGITVGNLFDDQKVFDVVVWGAPSIRETRERRWQPADRHPRPATMSV